MDSIPKKENITLAGDFNGRIGNQPIPECTGPCGEPSNEPQQSNVERFLCIS